MEMGTVIVLVGLAALAALVLALVLRGERAAGRLDAVVQSTRGAQDQLAERMAAQERALREMLEKRLSDMTKNMSDGLIKSTDRTVATMTEIQKRLAVIDEAQKNISALSTQMVGLQDILANKQARGAFGEVQLQDLVTAVLPPSAYAFQATLSQRTARGLPAPAAEPAGADRDRRQVPARILQRAGDGEGGEPRRRRPGAPSCRT